MLMRRIVIVIKQYMHAYKGIIREYLIQRVALIVNSYANVFIGSVKY